jgi:hypothetical protein
MNSLKKEWFRIDDLAGDFDFKVGETDAKVAKIG